MASVKDLYYDIESLFIDGKSVAEIADELACPAEYVTDILKSIGVVETTQDDFNPFDTVNS